MVDGDGNGYKDGSYSDSWTVANAGAPNNNQVSSEFFGGYAGKCPQGTEWRKQLGEWKCSGEPDWKQAVFLPEVTDGSNTIGMMVMPYNFKDTETKANAELRQSYSLSSWMTAYDKVPDQQADNNQDLEEMKVCCYPGSSQPDYGSATAGTDYFNDTVNIPATVDSPVGVSGTVDMSGHSTYTCEWSYINQDPGVVSNIGCVIELQNTESKCAGGSFSSIKDHFMSKQFSDGTSLDRDKKYSSEEVTSLMG